jgi:hypothetical protein
MADGSRLLVALSSSSIGSRVCIALRCFSAPISSPSWSFSLILDGSGKIGFLTGINLRG